MTRRSLFALFALAALAAATVGNAAIAQTVRLASVTTVRDGGLLDDLVADFRKQSGIAVEVYIGEDVFLRGRDGRADVILAHLGHRDAPAFVAEGFGQPPRAVLSNSFALIAPTGDPARIVGVADPVEAFRRIAEARAPFVVNDIDGLKYLVETLWHAAGRPDRSGWYVDAALFGRNAMQRAAQQRGYTIWGLTPFLRTQQQQPLELTPVLFADSLMQRVMGTTVVNADKVPGVNAAAAAALQDYLLSPATQARIRNFRLAGFDQPLFWPAAGNNATELLPPLR